MASRCYVYAIQASTTPLPAGLAGLGGAALSLVTWQDLAAVTSVVDPGELRPTAEFVLRHEAVIEGLRQHGPALPVRFATILADAHAVAHALAERHAVLTADLNRVGDKLEFGLTVFWERSAGHDQEPNPIPDQSLNPPKGVEAPGPGTRYLQARLSELRRESQARDAAGNIAQDLDRALSPQVCERRCTILPTPRIPVRAAYLLHPRQVEPFQEAFDRVRRGSSGLRFLLSGPWPPYSFVTPTAKGPQLALRGWLHDLGRQLPSERQDTKSEKAVDRARDDVSMIQDRT